MEKFCTCERTVSPDDDQSLNAICTEIFDGLSPTLMRSEFLAARRPQYRAALRDDAPYGPAFELEDLIVHDPFVAVVETDHFGSLTNGRSRGSANRRIHPRGIPSARDDSDSLHHFLLWSVSRPGGDHSGIPSVRLGRG